MRQRIVYGALALILLALGALGIFFGVRYYRQMQEQKVMAGFEALLGQESLSVAILRQYVDENLNVVSKENAALFVDGLERLQIENLPQWEQKYADVKIQQKLAQAFQDNEWALPDSCNVQDETLQTLLYATEAEGYKVETAEGFFFPVVDYAFYNQYLDKVPADLATYLAIMKTESDQVPAKDAALKIGWNEILWRAVRQEQFLNQYGDKRSETASAREQLRAETVGMLLKRYVMFALYGLNNTPLFDYEDGLMVAEARQAYQDFVDGADTDYGDNAPADADVANDLASAASAASAAAMAPRFTNLVREYLAVIVENGYQLTPAVNEFRQKAAAKAKFAIDSSGG